MMVYFRRLTSAETNFCGCRKQASNMKRLPLLISTAVVFLFHDLSLRAQGRVEGTVKLPARAAEAVAAKRYQVKNPAAIGAPDPPVAAVYLEGTPVAATSANSTNAAEM